MHAYEPLLDRALDIWISETGAADGGVEGAAQTAHLDGAAHSFNLQ